MTVDNDSVYLYNVDNPAGVCAVAVLTTGLVKRRLLLMEGSVGIKDCEKKSWKSAFICGQKWVHIT